MSRERQGTPGVNQVLFVNTGDPSFRPTGTVLIRDDLRYRLVLFWLTKHKNYIEFRWTKRKKSGRFRTLRGHMETFVSQEYPVECRWQWTEKLIKRKDVGVKTPHSLFHSNRLTPRPDSLFSGFVRHTHHPGNLLQRRPRKEGLVSLWKWEKDSRTNRFPKINHVSRSSWRNGGPSPRQGLTTFWVVHKGLLRSGYFLDGSQSWLSVDDQID